MVLKIDSIADGKCLVLRLSGRMQSEHVEQVKAQMASHPEVALDLQDLKLVDRDAVRFLCFVETNGTELRHCALFIREWIIKEKLARETEE